MKSYGRGWFVAAALVCLACMPTGRVYAVPTGCFVADGSYSCYGGGFFASDCDQYNMSAYYFGGYIASMCSYINTAESIYGACDAALSSCGANLNTVVAQRNSCLSDKKSCVDIASSIESNRQQWIAYARGRDALIKRLYRACGSKCKKIKG